MAVPCFAILIAESATTCSAIVQELLKEILLESLTTMLLLYAYT